MKQKEFFDLAEEMEKECGDWENSEGMSKEAYDTLMAKAAQMLEAEAAAKVKKPVAKKRILKKRYVIALAAVLALVMGTGVVGDRAWISDSNDLERETEVTTKVDNEDKVDAQLEEDEIYQEIAEKLGIAPIWLGYIPEGMELDSYVIGEETGWAAVHYLYNEKVFVIEMFKESIEISSNVQWDGDAEKLNNITNVHGYENNIEAYCIDIEHRNYGANITYGNGYYNLAGSIEKEEFIKILDGIYFKNL